MQKKTHKELRVVHYLGSLEFGGIERLVYDLVSQQIKRDSIKIAIGVGKFIGQFKTQFESLGTTLINFDLSSGFDVNPLKILKVCRYFKQYDVIHIHGFNLAVVLAAIFSRKKIIYTEHGNFGFGREKKIFDVLSFLLRKLFFKHINVNICCNSKFTMDYVETNFYSGNRLKVVYNGSNLNNQINENLKVKLYNKYKNKFIIGTSSRLAGFKKIDRLISIFSEYLKVNPKAVLVIVGDGIEKQNLLKQVSDLNIKQNVVFEGYQKEVATYQSIFDVCVFPSINEPFGLVAIECLSKKKPVLVFNDGGGITEIINRFQPKDICKDIKSMIERFQHYKINGFTTKNDFVAQLDFFSLERMEKDYFNEYKMIENVRN